MGLLDIERRINRMREELRGRGRFCLRRHLWSSTSDYFVDEDKAREYMDFRKGAEAEGGEETLEEG